MPRADNSDKPGEKKLKDDALEKPIDASSDQRIKFFDLWELEQRLLGQQKDDAQNSSSAADGANTPTATAARQEANRLNLGDLPNANFQIREDEALGYFERGYDTHSKKKTIGLALSGGGIRAASFSLGVMQGLNVERKSLESQCLSQPQSGTFQPSENNETAASEKARAPRHATMLYHIDYMSTVSGGGYAGAALTYYRHYAGESDRPYSDENDNDNRNINYAAFPKPETEVLNRDESRMLDFTRFRRNHLTPSSSLNLSSLFAVATANVLIAWSTYLAVLTFAMLIIYAAGMLFTPVGEWLFQGDTMISKLYLSLLGDNHDNAQTALISLEPVNEAQIQFALALGIGLIIFYVAQVSGTMLVSIVTRWREAVQYNRRRSNQISLGRILMAVMFAALYFCVPLLSELIYQMPVPVVVFFLASGVVAGVSLICVRNGVFAVGGLSPRFLLLLSAVVLMLSSLVIAYNIASLLAEKTKDLVFGPMLGYTAESVSMATYFAVIFFLTSGLSVALFASINNASLTRMYRDRLMEAFMPNPDVAQNKTIRESASRSDRLGLSECQQRPLHIINTNVVLSTSGQSRYRGRSGDSFILAPHYSGSWVTGYKLTKEFSHTPNTNSDGEECEHADNGMGLATAMAVSGAAFSPRVGPSGWSTILQHPLVSSMSSFLNLRLGYWVANPKTENQTRRATFWNTGIRGILNIWFDEDKNFIELTDGGHFENTGLFELLRRRVDVIILADASADRSFNFKDVGIAIERARVDQSVDIRFKCDAFDLTHLMPGSAGDTHYDERYGLAKRGYAVATVKYPAFHYEYDQKGKTVHVPEKTGLLFYLKPTVTRKMPADIYSYKGAHAEFPFQPITDQNFDESQFEAYRELGFQITRDMLRQFEHVIYDELSRNDEMTRNSSTE